MGIFSKDTPKTSEELKAEVLPTYEYITWSEYQQALNIIDRALKNRQIGKDYPYTLALVVEVSQSYYKNTPDQRARNKQYSVVDEMNDLIFKSKEEIEAEQEKLRQDKISRLKSEIDSKSKELADLAGNRG